MIKKLPWAEIIVITLVIAAGVGVYAYAHRSEPSLEESKRRGAAIVQALNAYRAEHGSWPDDLQQLVPHHIPAIEPPTWGLQRWRYRRYIAADLAPAGTARQDTLFQLSVAARESGYPVLFYDPQEERWVLNN